MGDDIQIAGNFVGTGVIAPGGQVTTAASTTSAAGLTVPLGVKPTSPNPGDLFTDTTRKNLGICGIAGGNAVWLQGCVQTKQQQTPALIPAGNLATIVAFDPLDANILASVGKRLIVTGSGMYTTVVAEVPVIQIKLLMITKTLIDLSTVAVAASQTNVPFWFHFEILTVTAAGASSVVRSTGVLHITTAAGTIQTLVYSPDVPVINIDLSSAGSPLVQAGATVTQLTSININEASLHITN